jgi:hypothetical protein
LPEVQLHGFYFEKWIKDTFFDCYSSTKYSDKWDIPKEKNKNFGNIPISIKTAKYRSAIGLGDALRQISIDEDFIMIVGYWIQEGNNKKLVNVSASIIDQKIWRKLWDPIKHDDILILDSLIKSYNEDYSKIRNDAQVLKAKSPYKDALITLNPKIDSKIQRRLQCSIGFNLYFDKIATKLNREKSENPILWGKEVPKPWESKSRTFNKIF